MLFLTRFWLLVLVTIHLAALLFVCGSFLGLFTGEWGALRGITFFSPFLVVGFGILLLLGFDFFLFLMRSELGFFSKGLAINTLLTVAAVCLYDALL